MESLKVFSLVYEGNTVENKVDATEDVNMIVDLNSNQLNLPAKVNAVMLDDSKQAVDVVWDIDDAKIAEMFANGAKKYDIVGTAQGMIVHCYVSMVEFNYIENYSFEEDANKAKQPNGWTVTDNAKADQLYVEENQTDSLTGSKHYHFWSASKNTINFDLEQEVKNLIDGEYKYSISIMGGDGGTTNIYAYVKVNGQIVKTEKLQITEWNDWHTALIEGIEVSASDKVVVGIHVECEGSGAGAWGKIDDALFNLVEAK